MKAFKKKKKYIMLYRFRFLKVNLKSLFSKK